MDNKIQLKERDNQPVFRIGLFTGQEHIDFRVMGKFHLEDGDGKELLKPMKSDLKWRVKMRDSRPGKEAFFLILYESFKREDAEKKLEIARSMDESAEIRQLGGEIYLKNKKLNDNSKYVITAGEYGSEMAARKAFKQFQPTFIPYFEKRQLEAPQGYLEIFDAEYDKSTEAANVVRIVPEETATMTKIFGVRSFDDLLQKEHFNDLVYSGVVELRFDIKGNLMGISEIPLEAYLKRVIYSEIGTDLPLEFSKSLAIVCRSEALARINHKRLGDPFDYGHTGETLRYFGEEFEDENIDKAVNLTTGQVVCNDGNISDTPFHLICGGHTENAGGMLGDGENPLLIGKLDSAEKPKRSTNLRKENNARNWILSRPETWCNMKGRELPASLERVKKFFRWEFNYSRRELEEIIRKKTGEDIGILFEIIPIDRGASARLREIELIGSLKNYRIRGQLNIREALAHEYLPSSCFLVERELDDTGTPISFTFVGAGHGHGVGMCKTGAAIMAMEKQNHKKILNHYFESHSIQKAYKL
ncbi:MAG: SpoIID/LytB domain-containing protein [Calditrichia bacterium]